MAIDAPSSAFYSLWPDRLRHAAIILLAAGLALAVLVAFGELSPVRAAAVFICISAAALVPWRLHNAVASREDVNGVNPVETAAVSAVVAGMPDPAVLLDRAGRVIHLNAAAAMQTKTAAARTSNSSPNATSTASARPAASRIMAECRNRSGHGEKKVVEEGASIAIGPALSLVGSASSGAVPTLSHIGGFARRLGVEPRRRLTQALHSCPQYNLSKRQQDYRYDKWRNIIEEAEQQHPCKQVFPVHLPQADQHGGIEHAEPTRGMAGEAQ